jgi:hypothetical protein
MGERIDQMARDAGFLKAGELTTSSAASEGETVFGMDVVKEPLMPEGYFALRTEKGALVVAPSGKRFWVPFGSAPSP